MAPVERSAIWKRRTRDCEREMCSCEWSRIQEQLRRSSRKAPSEVRLHRSHGTHYPTGLMCRIPGVSARDSALDRLARTGCGRIGMRRCARQLRRSITMAGAVMAVAAWRTRCGLMAGRSTPNVLQRRFGVDTAAATRANDITCASARASWRYPAVTTCAVGLTAGLNM